MRTLPLVIAVAVTALSTIAPVAHGAPTASAAPQSTLHKDTRFGFRLSAPKKWNKIPLKVDEQWLLAKWLSEKTYFWTDKGGGWTYEHKPEVMVIGFVHEITSGDGKKVTEEDEGKKITIEFSNPYKDYEDYLDRTYAGGGFYIDERKKTKFKGIEVTQLQIKVEKLVRDGPKRIVTWVYHLDGADVAVQFEVLEDKYGKLKSTINSTLKSFKPIPRDDIGLPTEAGVSSGWITISMMDEGTPAERKETRMQSVNQHKQKALANLPDGWMAKEYGSIFVISHVDDKYNKKVAEQAEAIFAWLDENLGFIGPDEFVRPPIIRICKDQDEERSFSQGRSSGGGWFTTGIEIVTHKDEDGMLGWETDWINRQLYSHWFQDRDRDLYYAMPRWVSYGMDEYIENLRLKGRKLEFRADSWDRDELRQLVRDGKATRPKDLMQMTSSAFMEGSSWDHQREAGALVNFFLSGKASKNKRTKGSASELPPRSEGRHHGDGGSKGRGWRIG